MPASKGIAKRAGMADNTTQFKMAMRPSKPRALPDTPEVRLENLIETALAAGFCLQ